MAFDPKTLKGSLKPIKGKRRAFFMFTDKDTDQQPFLSISKRPIKGSDVAAKKKEARGKVFIGRIYKDDDKGVYVFSSKQSIPAGRFTKAIRLIARRVKPLAGAVLESAPEPGKEEDDGEVLTTTPTDQARQDLSSLVPPEMLLDRGVQIAKNAAYQADTVFERTALALREAEARSGRAADKLLEREAALEARFAEDPACRAADERLEAAAEVASSAVDRYVEEADKLDDLNTKLIEVQQGREMMDLTNQIRDIKKRKEKWRKKNKAYQAILDQIGELRQKMGEEGADTGALAARIAALDAERRTLEDAEYQGYNEQIEELQQRQQDFVRSQEAEIERLEAAIDAQQGKVDMLEDVAKDANLALDRAEEASKSARDTVLETDPDAARLDMERVVASRRLDTLVNQEADLARENREAQARSDEARRKLQATADQTMARKYLDRIDKEFSTDSTAKALKARTDLRRKLNPRLLKLAQEGGDEEVLEERLAQTGNTLEEYKTALEESRPVTEPGQEVPTGDSPVSVSGDTAKEEMRTYLQGLSPKDKRNLAGFTREMCDWKRVKEESATSTEAMETMKAVRQLRNTFMDDALRETSAQFFDTLKAQLAASIPDGDNADDLRAMLAALAPVELDPKKKGEDPVYDDGRKRRYQLKFPPELAELFGDTLTLQYFAPGSTNPTSDIDMQFICEESPTACTDLIETFRGVCQERLGGLEEVLNEELADELAGDKMKLGNLAQVFDTNPYPAGFVNREEQELGLHFSDTFTRRSVEDKKIADIGLAMIRNLESPEHDTDPVARMMAEAEALGDPVAATKAQRALAVGVAVSLRSHIDQADAVLKSTAWTAELGDLKDRIAAALGAARALGAPDVASSWMDTPPAPDVLSAMQAASRGLQALLHELSGKGGTAMISEARYAAFVKAQQEVERLTQARDLALADGADRIAKARDCVKLAERHEQAQALLADDRLAELPSRAALQAAVTAAAATIKDMRGALETLPPDIPVHAAAIQSAIQALRVEAKAAKLKVRKPERGPKAQQMDLLVEAELESMRASSSALGVSAFLMQGMALNNADEAYTSRGAIGLVVEKDQIGKSVLATTGTAISSLESNAGFFHEHVREEVEHGVNIDKAVSTPEEKDKLTKFCVGVAKYVERITSAFNLSDPSDLKDALPVDLSWLGTLTRGLLALKDGRHPENARKLAKMEGVRIEDVTVKFLALLGIHSIGDLQKKIALVESQARTTMWAQESVGGKPPPRPLAEELRKTMAPTDDPDDWEDED